MAYLCMPGGYFRGCLEWGQSEESEPPTVGIVGRLPPYERSQCAEYGGTYCRTLRGCGRPTGGGNYRRRASGRHGLIYSSSTRHVHKKNPGRGGLGTRADRGFYALASGSCISYRGGAKRRAGAK
jgi:hypothetical protein